MGNIGPSRLRLDVLPLGEFASAVADPLRATEPSPSVPAPEPMPAPYPEPTPDRVPGPGSVVSAR